MEQFDISHNDIKMNEPTHTRRRFLEKSSCLVALSSFPNLLLANKSGNGPLVLGNGGHRYEVQHDFLKLPDRFHWQTTHNVAVDMDGLIYVIHEGLAELNDHPSIFVFDPDGRYIRSFGKEFQGGGHGLEVRTEGSEQFLYVTGYQQLKKFAKLTLKGETIWEKRAPMDSGLYPKGEDTHPEKRWGRNAFMPTNFAFREDGGFYVADGYGSYRIHQYDQNANWLGMFGEPGKRNGQFNTSHGLWIDRRSGREEIVIADRANHRLQWFTNEGKHLQTLDGFILPANVDSYGDLLLVPDLSARVTLLDRNNKVIAHLGEDEEWRKRVMGDGRALRRDESGKSWASGRFLHPHDACFDLTGNILVAEWVQTGRMTRLKKVS